MLFKWTNLTLVTDISVCHHQHQFLPLYLFLHQFILLIVHLFLIVKSIILNSLAQKVCIWLAFGTCCIPTC